MAERKRVGVERTILCATRFWSHVPGIDYAKGATRGTLSRSVRNVVRKQGYSGPAVERGMRKLEKGGFIATGGKGVGKTIALTEKGGRVACGTVKLAPWTDSQYPGSQLRGSRR